MAPRRMEAEAVGAAGGGEATSSEGALPFSTDCHRARLAVAPVVVGLVSNGAGEREAKTNRKGSL